MVFRSTGRGAARILFAASVGFGASMAHSQTQPAPAPPPAEIDPNAPLDPMPDLGVPWPDMAAPDANPAQPAPAGTVAATPSRSAGEAVSYRVQIEGLDRLDPAAAAAVHAGFQSQ